MRSSLTTLLLSAIAASALEAQGSLSTQGFGFPPGQLGSSSFGSSGALAEFDPVASINPAALSRWRGSLLFAEYQPELRRVTAGTTSAHTTTARFPSMGANMEISPRLRTSVGFSTFLDRSWSTRGTTQQVIGPDTVVAFQSARSIGALNDLRVAAAYDVGRQLSVGIGLHTFIGRNALTYTQTYEDTLRFTQTGQSNVVTFRGFGLSGGAVLLATRDLSLAVSARVGGNIDVRTATDTVLASATAPVRFGAGLKYDLSDFASLGVRVSHEGWSSLKSLGTSSMSAYDSWDVAGGGEVTARRLLKANVTLRGGARYRTLPFGYNGSEVHETSFSTGLGLPLSGGFAMVDAGFQFANRSIAAGGISEKAFLFSFGVRIRP